MLITSNFVWEIWHYRIRVEDIDSTIQRQQMTTAGADILKVDFFCAVRT